VRKVTLNLKVFCNVYAQLHAINRCSSLQLSCVAAGTLPPDWGNSGAFPSLRLLFLQDTPFSGTLPAAWGSSVAFPALEQLQLGATVANLSLLSGTLPATWGSSQAFPRLETLRVTNCSIQGTHQHLMARHTGPLKHGHPSFAESEAFSIQGRLYASLHMKLRYRSCLCSWCVLLSNMQCPTRIGATVRYAMVMPSQLIFA
jgi:hypothetical protein